MQGKYYWICESLGQYLYGPELDEKADTPHYKHTLVSLGLICAHGSWKGRNVILCNGQIPWGWGSAASEARNIAKSLCFCKTLPRHHKGCPVALIGL